MYNNVSYRRFTPSGTTFFSFASVGATVRTQPAINAWTGATRNTFEPDPGNDGIGIVGCKVTNPSAGVWHYEYAVYNQNLDRAIQSFSVPLGCGVTLSNVGFHAPPQPAAFANDGTVGSTGGAAPLGQRTKRLLLPGTQKPSRKIRTRTRFAGARCIISVSIPTNRLKRL